MSRWWLWLAWLFAAPAVAKERPAPVTITVTQAADGSWTADYRFRQAAGAWMFLRSNPDLDGKPWRQRSWTVETPGVRLERHGRYDALVAAGSVPRRVRVRFTPLGEPLRADYQPALIFSDRSVALYPEHFVVAPQPDAVAVAALGFELSDLTEPPTTTELRAPGRRILVRGKATRNRIRLGPGETDTYAYIGDLPLIEAPALAAVIDPAVPGWVRRELDPLLPRLLAHYTERLGKPAGERPQMMLSWGGTERKGVSLSGSVLDGLVVMNFAGQQLAMPSALVLDRLRLHVAHEAAHLWMGHTVRYASPSGAWITEGGADLLAIRTVERLVPEFDAGRELQRAIDECLKVNGAKALSGASARGEVRANYACGAVLMLIAEAAERRSDAGADATTFAKRLIEANRADGVVTQAEWLAAFGTVTGDAALTARVETYVDQGDPDPVGFIAALFTATGVRFAREGERIVLG